MGQINRFIRNLICFPIVLYRLLLSPIIQPCCRYYPSCSQYALAAIKNYGVFKGGWLAVRRLLRCHPWAEGGYDPVSPNEEKL
ncbi:Putative membrane protein insertion efficiency factor [Legionella massiliensis]|uniref:Putative membrane protein insertion efficiency factor n=1 Tax=Legionella massiliensis TaxID=1034943 RepID=A0A078KWQ5_9GAMM|nr:membrane protein insertion efficiency factor YidD [Legionella massiliensis]CDZ76168.1 Putative membrane protein insertion efficiency factor [Legionella massiliensis]CEE11906.1 Putative membrane protein insertion efficiency factor [Legionella massiliensis]